MEKIDLYKYEKELWNDGIAGFNVDNVCMLQR